MALAYPWRDSATRPMKQYPILLLMLPACAMQDPTALQPPVAKKSPHEITWHGDTRIDDYFWMKEREAPEVTAHLEAENAFAESVLSHTAGVQQTIYNEIVGRIVETDLDVPVRRGGHWYYSRTEEGKQQRIYCRKAGTLDAPEQVILDLNVLGEDLPFIGLGNFSVTDDGRLLAYTLDTNGFRQYQLRFKDLDSGEEVGFTAPRVTSLAWAADGQTLLFTQEDEITKRSHILYRQRLDEVTPTPVLEEGDERFRVSVSRTKSRAFLVTTVSSHTTSEVHVLRATDPAGGWRLIAPRQQDQEYYVAHRGDRFYIRTNDQGRNFRVATTPIDAPGRDNWQPLHTHSDDVMIAGLAVFKDYHVLTEREDGLPHLRLVGADGTSHRITMPEAVYGVSLGNNPEFDTDSVRYHYQSMTTPDSVYDYDVADRTRVLRKRTEVRGDYDPAAYVSERIWARAADGARIPVSLVYRKDLQQDGNRPAYLVGYGSYGYPYPISFSHARVSMLDRGVVCAVAHIRGGGELGKPWHDQGRMFNKLNSFTDFIDVAEHLVRDGWTNPSRLAIEGGSAGGLLMGAVANLRPDLFQCVVSHVPFVDVLTTMLDEDLPLTVGEFEEWGNPKVEAEYHYIRRYCPYSNLEARAYPATMVKTSFHDSQVMYWEPAKYVAKLRELKTNDTPLVFVVNMKGGHGGSSGRYDRYREVAQDYAFMLWQLGVE